LVDPYGNGGGKHDVLSLTCCFTHVSEDLLHIVLEALLKHGVGLVDADHFQLIQDNGPSLEQIDESSGSGNYDGNTTVNFSHLLLNGSSSIQCYYLVGRGKFIELVGDLHDQLSRGTQDEEFGGFDGRLVVFGTVELLEDGQGVGKGLA
jgi:hypothetical protein